MESTPAESELKFSGTLRESVRPADLLWSHPAHEAVRRDVEARYGVKRLGEAEGVVERFHAISVERRLKHPAAIAISRAAHEEVFAS